MSAPDRTDPIDEFLAKRGLESPGWETSYNKKQCPECGGLHGDAAAQCSVCGWTPQ